MRDFAAQRVSGPALAAALLAAGFATSQASAATVTLNGSGQMGYTYEYLGANPAPTTTTGNDYVLSVPGQYALVEQFTSAQTVALGTSSVGQYDYIDRYQFHISAPASGDVLTASLNLGSLFNVANLQFRLYQITSTPTGPGLPAGSTPVTAWLGQNSPGVNVNGTAFSASFTGIQTGDYILDIAGIANGALGGTVVGQLNLQPVPLPAAAWLLSSGLGLLGAVRRRRLFTSTDKTLLPA